MTTTSSTTSSTSTTATAAAATASSSSSTNSSSLGQSILTSLNATGSGIDTGALVTNLTAAQKASLEDPITAQQTAVTAQISTVASIASDLSAFSTSLNTLVSGGTLQTQPVSSDTSVLSASAIVGAPVGELSATVTVTALAKGQTIESQPVSSATGAFSGTSTLTITTSGRATAAITGFTDLASMVTAINAKTSTTGVTASVVTDGDGAHLVMKGTTGAAQGFTVSSSDAELSGFAYTPTEGDVAAANVSSGTGMQRLQAAQNAAYTIDGVAYSSASNTVTDSLPGVKMVLSKVGTATLGSTRPTAAITEAMTDFVSAYNSLLDELNTATAAATSSSDAGPLRGNATIRDLRNQLSKLTTTKLNSSGTIRTLAELGVKTAQDGTLSLDTTTLSNMLTQHPDDVEAMFTTSQSSSSSKVLITNTAGTVASGVYAITGLAPATGGGDAAGALNGVAMSAKSWNLTATTGDASGLKLQILSGTPGSATITINQGLGGALQLIKDTLTGTSGALTTLSSRLTTQSTTLADKLTAAESQLTVYHDRLVSQFSQMNTLVSGYKATSSYLTQQVALWTKSDS